MFYWSVLDQMLRESAHTSMLANWRHGRHTRWADSSGFFFLGRGGFLHPTGCAFIKGRVQLPGSRGKFSLFFPAGGVQSLSKLGLSKRHAKKTSPLVTSWFRSVYILLMEAPWRNNLLCVGGGILISGSQGHIDVIRALQCGKIDFHVVLDFFFYCAGIQIMLPWWETSCLRFILFPAAYL